MELRALRYFCRARRGAALRPRGAAPGDDAAAAVAGDRQAGARARRAPARAHAAPGGADARRRRLPRGGARHAGARGAGRRDWRNAPQRGEVGRLAVGYLAATAFTLLPLVLRDFSRGFPGVKLELRELTIPQQHAALLKGDIDVAILRPPVSEAELASEIVLAERVRARAAGAPSAARAAPRAGASGSPASRSSCSRASRAW